MPTPSPPDQTAAASCARKEGLSQSATISYSVFLFSRPLTNLDAPVVSTPSICLSLSTRVRRTERFLSRTPPPPYFYCCACSTFERDKVSASKCPATDRCNPTTSISSVSQQTHCYHILARLTHSACPCCGPAPLSSPCKRVAKPSPSERPTDTAIEGVLRAVALEGYRRWRCSSPARGTQLLLLF